MIKLDSFRNSGIHGKSVVNVVDYVKVTQYRLLKVDMTNGRKQEETGIAIDSVNMRSCIKF